MRVTARCLVLLATALLAACGGAPQPAAHFDLIVRGGTVYDGSGGTPYPADLGIRGDAIAAIGDLSGATAATSIDATGLAVAPGFVNMMCWANESLIEDGRSQSDIRQGVTLEVMGEGESMGPLNAAEGRAGAARRTSTTRSPDDVGEYLSPRAARGLQCGVILARRAPRGRYDDGPTPTSRAHARAGPPGDAEAR
jgi:N-acyl-D-amino-acid deacylase